MRLRVLCFLAFVVLQFLLPPLATAGHAVEALPDGARDADVRVFVALLLAVFGLAPGPRRSARTSRSAE